MLHSIVVVLAATSAAVAQYSYPGAYGGVYGGQYTPTYGTNYGLGYDSGVTICTDVNYRGRCRTINAPSGRCTNVPRRFNDKTSSMRVPFGRQCTLFADYNCQGGAFRVSAPGLSNFVWTRTNDALSSMICS